MKMLAGSFSDYTGQILVNSREVFLHSPSVAKQGIGMIYRAESCRPISIAENILAGRLPKKGPFLDKTTIIEIKAAMKRVGRS